MNIDKIIDSIRDLLSGIGNGLFSALVSVLGVFKSILKLGLSAMSSGGGISTLSDISKMMNDAKYKQEKELKEIMDKDIDLNLDPFAAGEVHSMFMNRERYKSNYGQQIKKAEDAVNKLKSELTEVDTKIKEANEEKDGYEQLINVNPDNETAADKLSEMNSIIEGLQEQRVEKCELTEEKVNDLKSLRKLIENEVDFILEDGIVPEDLINAIDETEDVMRQDLFWDILWEKPIFQERIQEVYDEFSVISKAFAKAYHASGFIPAPLIKKYASQLAGMPDILYNALINDFEIYEGKYIEIKSNIKKDFK